MAFMGAAAVILNAQGEVLLVRHTYGKCNWEIPGGGAEAGESPVDTAIREVREETGLCVTARHMTGYYHDRDGGGTHFVFRCEIDTSEADTSGADKPEAEARPDGGEYRSAATGLRTRCHVRSVILLSSASRTRWPELPIRCRP